MGTLFISDLHLTPARPQVIDLFLTFLQGRARQSDALYILGDLFEYWIGDEAVDEPALACIVEGLRTLTRQGVPVYLMHGNRDFLLGPRFAAATGCTLLPETHDVDLGGERVLLMHGDTLCTDDVEYQRFRQQIRQPAWIAAFLARDLKERVAMAQQYREMSRNATRMKASDIMDVHPETVRATMLAHQVRILIHGHTHRPGRHAVPLALDTGERIVLGDWYDQGSVLEYREGQYHLEQLALPGRDSVARL